MSGTRVQSSDKSGKRPALFVLRMENRSDMMHRVVSGFDCWDEGTKTDASCAVLSSRSPSGTATRPNVNHAIQFQTSQEDESLAEAVRKYCTVKYIQNKNETEPRGKAMIQPILQRARNGTSQAI